MTLSRYNLSYLLGAGYDAATRVNIALPNKIMKQQQDGLLDRQATARSSIKVPKIVYVRCADRNGVKPKYIRYPTINGNIIVS